MMFVTGPLYAGKREWVCRTLNLTEPQLAERALWDVQDLVGTEDPEKLADRLCEKEILIATEIGGGLVPLDPEARAHREAAGRLACTLAARADVVVRVCCGLPQVLKGRLP
ncbi:MAG: bifunctional adenosylcobinamide kinase/adenosylcobinamide-phosphate guanylyltransferase [Oscillospiraceae bacterium]|nr:bifunctional adenosylcobinamide kinase/adenosylcobinamide-phosphate guanylyltransferase [Oscillospiraceae bacterium]